MLNSSSIESRFETVMDALDARVSAFPEDQQEKVEILLIDAMISKLPLVFDEVLNNINNDVLASVTIDD